MPKQEASSQGDALVNGWFTWYWTPTFFHSDQGKQIESPLFQEVGQLLGTKKNQTIPFHLQSDSQSQRSINMPTKMLAMATKKQYHWDTCLPFITMAYRATPKVSTGITPIFLMFGQETMMPVDLTVRLPPTTPVDHGACTTPTEAAGGCLQGGEASPQAGSKMSKEHL